MSISSRNIVYCSDVSGTGFWRHIQQILNTNANTSYNINNTYTQIPILQKDYYKGMNSVVVQRWISDYQFEVFTKFLKPICDINSCWLIYGIDDAMHYDEIPLFNRGREPFANESTQAKIKYMLNASDLVVVTTDYLKHYYNRKYEVPLENIVAVPNFLPKWWFGDRFDPERKLDQFRKNKQKPRIGIVGSLSHYNIEETLADKDGKAVYQKQAIDGSTIYLNQDGKQLKKEDCQKIEDDFDGIADTVLSTINDVKWVFFGYCPKQLEEFARKKLIEVYPCTTILEYPSMLEHLQLQAIVANVSKTEFNYCKSHIKYIEASAIGVPLFATNCLPYSRVMPKTQLFDDSEQLKKMVLNLKSMSAGVYNDIIMRQWKDFNSPHKEGDFDIVNYWLEDNMKIWVDMFRLRNKPLSINFDFFAKQYKSNLEYEKNHTLFKNENIMILG